MPKHRCLIGSYAETEQEGILCLELDFENQTFERVGGLAGLSNPSYLCFDPVRSMIYAVEEESPVGSLAAVRCTGISEAADTRAKAEEAAAKAGETAGGGAGTEESISGYEEKPAAECGMTLAGRVSTGAQHPCHVALSPDGRFLSVANYSADLPGGSAVLYRVEENGLPVQTDCFYGSFSGEGPGPDPVRQNYPHIHFTAFFDSRLLACDLGADKVYQLVMNADTGRLESLGADFAARPGCGPRHLISPDAQGEWVYLVSELDAMLHVLHLEQDSYPEADTADTPSPLICLPGTLHGSYSEVYTVDTLPAGITAQRRAANRVSSVKLSEDGRYLFVGNRGEDVITALRIGADHRPVPVSMAPCGAAEPRDFAVCGDCLVIANQAGQALTVLHFDRATEALTLTDMRLETEICPSCVVFF